MRLAAKLIIPVVIALALASLVGDATTVSGQSTQTPTATATGTATSTATATATSTATATATATTTATATATTTATATATSTVTPPPSTGTITNGSVPASGFGLITWGGGTVQQLVTRSNCSAPTLTFWSTSNGLFVVYVHATTVTVVNEAFLAMFPGGVIPPNTPLLSRCTGGG